VSKRESQSLTAHQKGSDHWQSDLSSRRRGVVISIQMIVRKKKLKYDQRLLRGLKPRTTTLAWATSLFAGLGFTEVETTFFSKTSMLKCTDLPGYDYVLNTSLNHVDCLWIRSRPLVGVIAANSLKRDWLGQRKQTFYSLLPCT
jgi:hypothetical protein